MEQPSSNKNTKKREKPCPRGTRKKNGKCVPYTKPEPKETLISLSLDFRNTLDPTLTVLPIIEVAKIWPISRNRCLRNTSEYMPHMA